MSRTMAEFIGNQIGVFRDVELDSGVQFWGSSLRIQVGLDITKPLRRVLKLHTTMGAESTLTFTYERLPNFCYWCGCLGHILKLCECQFEPGFDANQDPLPFGPWLWATTPANLQSRGSTFAPYRPTPPSIISDHHPSPNSHRGAAIFSYSPSITRPIPRSSQHNPTLTHNGSNPTSSNSPLYIDPTPTKTPAPPSHIHQYTDYHNHLPASTYSTSSPGNPGSAPIHTLSINPKF
ncbi:hypothetical protein Salat_1719900 [Sesamum alatum]|uniref:Zinc knuckle CX2CX4HX4C domain-containing protein n=1 Tax=Sesamum alatum TaxID=300844 RepID=A0AAE1Y7T4_9LAMI|nr:hypothetical protein Salat_1719900 [Sesamum alatum]